MELLQLICALALTALYIGLAWVLSGVVPVLGWFLAPALVMLGAGFLSYLVTRALPISWVDSPPALPPPRRLRLSWRSTFILPVLTPWWVFLGRIVETSARWDVGPVRTVAIALPAALLASMVLWMALRSKRELRLLREGEVAIAFVDGRYADEGFDWVGYRFVAADGTAVARRAEDRGYRVEVGSTVPVFYDPRRPTKHLLASASWFEVSPSS